MAELTLQQHAPLDMVALSALFASEDDMRAAHPSAKWPFEPGEWMAWLDPAEDNAPYFICDGPARIGHFALRSSDVPEQRHLAWLILAEAHRGGKGRLIMALAEAAARRDLGARCMTLRVLHANARAHHLYQSCGYRVVEGAPDKSLMRKDFE